MFENLDEQFGSRSGPKFFVPELGLKPLVKFISRHLLCRHTFHMKYSVLHSQILKKNEIQQTYLFQYNEISFYPLSVYTLAPEII